MSHLSSSSFRMSCFAEKTTTEHIKCSGIVVCITCPLREAKRLWFDAVAREDATMADTLGVRHIDFYRHVPSGSVARHDRFAEVDNGDQVLLVRRPEDVALAYLPAG